MALVVIGLLSIQKVLGPVIAALLILGSVGGFLFSWYMRNSRPPHIDTFIGMLSLASVVVILSRLYETDISFENLLPPSITWRKDKIGYEPPQKQWMEQKQIKEQVMEGRRKLVNEKILHSNVLNEPVAAEAANAGTKTSWNQLMVSHLFK